jgi:V/A-type H+-transporting ATPase subunit K
LKKALSLLVLIASATALALLAWSLPAAAQATARVGLTGEAAAWGLLAAALATGMSSLGAGIAVARLGTAAVGALAEKPELLGRLLIFVGLAEGIAIYGVIISILILERLA